MYDVSFEVSRKFENELDATRCVPVFPILFQALADDPSKYEIKIAILEGLISKMNRDQVETFMNIMEETLSMPADYNIFK